MDGCPCPLLRVSCSLAASLRDFVKLMGNICLPPPADLALLSQTLFNPNKTVVKMFLVTYDFHDMPANHITFLRHRIFLVPVDEEAQGPSSAPGGLPKRVLCYLMHLR